MKRLLLCCTVLALACVPAIPGQQAPPTKLLIAFASYRDRPKYPDIFFYEHDGNTLTVWFDDPRREAVVEETGDEVILMKDDRGRVIGFEKLNFTVPDTDSVHVAVESIPA